MKGAELQQYQRDVKMCKAVQRMLIAMVEAREDHLKKLGREDQKEQAARARAQLVAQREAAAAHPDEPAHPGEEYEDEDGWASQGPDQWNGGGLDDELDERAPPPGGGSEPV